MLLVVTTPEAEHDLDRIDAWWRKHRGQAPHLFLEELADAFALLARWPEAGRSHRHAKIPGLRRLLLRATKYHVYYVLTADLVMVLSIWSAVRGRGPILRPR